MTKLRPPSVAAESIESFLKDGPLSNAQLMQLTGYSRSGVHNQLERMELLGIVHRERIEINRAAGYCHIWRLGPALGIEPPVRGIPGYTPKQKTVRQYEPINRRDELVAALFGHAGESK